MSKLQVAEAAGGKGYRQPRLHRWPRYRRLVLAKAVGSQATGGQGYLPAAHRRVGTATGSQAVGSPGYQKPRLQAVAELQAARSRALTKATW